MGLKGQLVDLRDLDFDRQVIERVDEFANQIDDLDLPGHRIGFQLRHVFGRKIDGELLETLGFLILRHADFPFERWNGKSFTFYSFSYYNVYRVLCRYQKYTTKRNSLLYFSLFVSFLPGVTFLYGKSSIIFLHLLIVFTTYPLLMIFPYLT